MLSKFFYYGTRALVVLMILKWTGIFDVETIVPKIHAYQK